ncbi:MAG TPA: hypothetical protein VNH18_28660, partial [Bryobacteraceae bacterium]|nr:hypothetical protein [Bryobacteraceae bacterium]
NVFLFGNSGLGANTQLAALNQWSFFFRISRQFRWGKDLSGSGDLAQYAAVRVPLVGVVQGLVMEQSIGEPRPAASVSISIDNSRTALTDASGHYVFTEVPEGPHEIALNMEQLPTDYEPGPEPRTKAAVTPRGMVRADFSVFRLTSVAGRVAAPKEATVDGVIIRVKDTRTYTTPDADGIFTFSNLREGRYQIAIDEKSIPPGYELKSPAAVAVDAIASHPPQSLLFELAVKAEEVKPVRELQLKSQPIRVK